jgi:exopolysaccharide biosynthesis polyprenyl glycosylphosphotransferase
MSLAQRIAWLDGCSIAAVLAVALVLWPNPATTADAWRVLISAAVIVLLCVASFYYNDLYDFEAPHALGHVFSRLCRALGIAALALALTYVLFPSLVVAGNAVSYALLFTLGAVLTMRACVYALAKRRPFAERVVIMGRSALAADLAHQIRSRADLAMTLVGSLGDGALSTDAGRHLGRYADVAEIVRRHRPDRILVAMPDRRGNLPVTDLLACRFRGIRVEDGTSAYERFTRRLAVESLTPSALIFADGFRVTRARLAVKRVMSVVIAFAGLAISAPFIALVAILIRIESPGPAFFVQERIGLGGRPFRLIKFRTMREATAGDADLWERDNASRVTRAGAFLRRYRLDEVPQFINILRGDMSLIGPRPEMASNVETFAAVIPYYNLRHEVRPGLTGWAQVRAGYSMSTEEVTRKLCYDLYYIKHLSVGFDLRILFDTVKFVLGGQRPG